MAKILDYANDVSVERTRLVRTAVSNSGFAKTQSGSPAFYQMTADLRPLTKAQFNEVNAELIDLADGVNFLDTTIPSSFDVTNGIGGYQTKIITANVVSFTIDAMIPADATVTVDGFTPGNSPAAVGNVLNISGSYIIVNGVRYNASRQTGFGPGEARFRITGGASLGLSAGDSFSFIPVAPLSVATSGSTTSINLTGFLDGQTDTLKRGDFIQFVDSLTDNTTTKVYNLTTDVDATSMGTGTVVLNDAPFKQVNTTHTVRVGNDVVFRFLLTEVPGYTVIPGPGFNYYQFDTFNFREVLE